MRSTINKRILAGIVLLGLLGSAGRAPALTAEVRDEAGLFKPEAVAQANEVIKEIKQRSQKDLFVETRHVPEDKRHQATSPDQHVKSRFFADWAIQRARAEGVNGIYVLITREPGHVEVAVGNHTRAVFPDEDRHRLAQILLNRFKNKEYDQGLFEGVRYVRSALAAKPREAAAAAPAGWEPRGADGSAGWGLPHWLGLGLAVLLGVWPLSAVFRALSSAGSQPAYGGYGGSAGYGPAGGGGGFFPSLLGGLFGAAAGSWLYDRFSGGQSAPGAGSPVSVPAQDDTGYTAEGGGFDTTDRSGGDDGGSDLNGDDSRWSDMGGGGDFGGGDDGGGGDF